MNQHHAPPDPMLEPEQQALTRLLHQLPQPPTRTTTEQFWAQLAPQLPQRQASLGMGWVWGGIMALVFVLTQAIMLALLLAGLANFAGLAPTRWLQVETAARWSTSTLIGTVLRPLLDYSLLGMALDSPVAPLLPQAFILLTTTGLALAFLGWTLATLRKPQIHNSPFAIHNSQFLTGGK